MEDELFQSGAIVGGRYAVRRQIGRGGTSTVYLVEDLGLGKEWAMKVMDGGGMTSAQRRQMASEISVLRKLSHPNLPRIVDAIEINGKICLFMDYIEGVTLRQLTEKYGALDEETVVGWALELTDVLSYLHGFYPPIIYRDLKPGNIMLKKDGRVVLFDFGIAREYKEAGAKDTTCLGTVGYAAPEQFGGKGQSDERTDIYGLGATLYHLLTGADPSQPPYEMIPVRRIRPGLSGGLEKVILTCTKRNPDERYQNCRELQEALRSYRQMDDAFLRQEKKKLLFFFGQTAVGLCLVVCSLILGMMAAGKKADDYASLMSEAGTLAAESLYRGSYNPEVLALFLEAIDLEPMREEAYISLLNYCEDSGETASGVTAVCARIDVAGGIQSAELLFRVAELYFSGSEEDPDFSVDYRRAARYFSMIDASVYPEAEKCAHLASALGTFGGELDWASIRDAVDAFAAGNASTRLTERRVRNVLMCAEFYITNRYDLEKADSEAALKIRQWLETALKDAERLSENSQSAHLLKKRAMGDLAAFLVTDRGTASEAADYFRQLQEYESSEEKKLVLRLRAAAAEAFAGEAGRAEKDYQDMIRDYPETAEVYFQYCGWLLEMGRREEAEELFCKAEQLDGAEETSNYHSLKERLGSRAGLA